MRDLLEKHIRRLRPNSQRRYLTALNDLDRFMKGRLDLITENDVFNYFDELCERDGIAPREGDCFSLSSRTVRNQIDVLKAMFRSAKKRGAIDRNPFETADLRMPHLKSNEKRPTQMLDFEQVLEFCNTPSRFSREGVRDRAILAALFGGALRRTEVINLRICDVCRLRTDIGEGLYLKLFNTKSQKPEEQPLPAWATERILLLVEQRLRDGAISKMPLVTQYRGRGTQKLPDNKHVPGSTFGRWFDANRRAAGLPEHITIHSARATAISYLFDLGIPLRSIQMFARHASAQTTEIYDKRNRTSVCEKAAQLLCYDKNHSNREKVVARDQHAMV